MDLRTGLRWAAITIVLITVAGSITLYTAAAVTSDVPVTISVGGGADAASSLDRAAIERRVHDQVNDERTQQDRKSLPADEGLRALARAHSRQMHAEGFVGHEGPDGTTMSERYERLGISCPAKGENVHYERIRTRFGVAGVGLRKQLNESVVASEIVEGWRSSRAHYENLLREDWDRQGIGVHLVQTGPFLDVYATQNFCGSSVSITVTPGE